MCGVQVYSNLKNYFSLLNRSSSQMSRRSVIENMAFDNSETRMLTHSNSSFDRVA